MRFGLFLMCFNTAYKLILRLLRRLGSRNNSINVPAAGIIAALTLAIDSVKRRQLITILTISRALEAILWYGESSQG